MFSNLKLIGAVLALLIAFGLGWYIRNIDFINYKAKVVAEGKIQEQHNKDLLKQQALINQGIKNDYQNKLNSINAMYARMRQSSSGSMPTFAYSSITINGASYDPLSIAKDCALETQKLISLQDWVKKRTQ